MIWLKRLLVEFVLVTLLQSLFFIGALWALIPDPGMALVFGASLFVFLLAIQNGILLFVQATTWRKALLWSGLVIHALSWAEDLQSWPWSATVAILFGAACMLSRDRVGANIDRLISPLSS